MPKCPELSRLPRLHTLPRSLNFKHTTRGSLSPYLGSPLPTRILDPSHPAASIPRNKVLSSFPFTRADGFHLRAIPKALLYKPEVPYPDPPYGPAKKDPRKVDVSLLKIVAKRSVHKSAVIRTKVSIKFKTAMSLIVTRGADAETDKKGRTKLVFRSGDAGKDRWTLEDWTYLAILNLELYRMPYTQLIPDLRRALTLIKTRAEKLNAQWQQQRASQAQIPAKQQRPVQKQVRSRPQQQGQVSASQVSGRSPPLHTISTPKHVGSASDTPARPQPPRPRDPRDQSHRVVPLRSTSTPHPPEPSSPPPRLQADRRDYSTVPGRHKPVLGLILAAQPAPPWRVESMHARSASSGAGAAAPPSSLPSSERPPRAANAQVSPGVVSSAPADPAILSGEAAPGPFHEMVGELLRDAAPVARSASFERMFSAAATEEGGKKTGVGSEAEAEAEESSNAQEEAEVEADEDWEVQEQLLLAGAGTTVSSPWHYGIDPFAYWPAQDSSLPKKLSPATTKRKQPATDETQFPSVYDYGPVADPVRPFRLRTPRTDRSETPSFDYAHAARKAALERARPALSALIRSSRLGILNGHALRRRLWWIYTATTRAANMRKAEKLRQEQESEERAGAQAEAEVTPASQEGAAAMAQVPEATDAETPGASPDRPQMSPDPPKETAAESISPPAHRSRRSERLERVNAGQSARVGSSAPSAREAEDSASTDAQDTASKSTPGRSQRDGTPSPRSEVHTRRKAQPFGLKPLESPPPEPEPAPLVDSTKVPFGLRPPDVPPSVRRAPAPSKDVPFGLKPAPSPAQEYREERRSASEAALPRPDPPQPAPVRQQADSARVRQQTDPASRPQPTTVQPAVPAEPPTPAPIASFAETLASRQIAERRQPVPGRRLLPYGVTPPPPRDPAVQYSRLEPYALEDRPSSHTQSYQQKETRSKSSTRRAIHPKDDEPSQWYNKALSEIDPDLVKATRKRWQQRGNSSQQEDSSWPGANRSPREDVWALPADAAPSNPEERRRPSKRSR